MGPATRSGAGDGDVEKQKAELQPKGSITETTSGPAADTYSGGRQAAEKPSKSWGRSGLTELPLLPSPDEPNDAIGTAAGQPGLLCTRKLRDQRGLPGR